MAESEAQAAYRKLVNDMANEKTTDIADIGDILERAGRTFEQFQKDVENRGEFLNFKHNAANN